MRLFLTQLGWLPILFLLFSCGGMEDTPTPIEPETDPLLRIESLVVQLENLEIGVPTDWKQTRDPVERAAYTRFLLNVGAIPIILDLNEIYTSTDDFIIHIEYYRASLIKRFGDIQQVHTLADYPLKSAFSILPTDTELNNVVEAHAFLFPDSPILEADINEIPLFYRSTHRKEQDAVAKIRMENPKTWTEYNRAQLIKKHGDTPDIHIVADFMEKLN